VTTARGQVPIRRRSPISTRPAAAPSTPSGPLAGFTGVLQVDGYAAYQALADPGRAGGPVTLAYCWSHVRRRFYEIAQSGDAPIAEAALQRINVLYHVEAMIRVQAPEQRQAVRHQHSKPVLDDLRT
jgi:transposase